MTSAVFLRSLTSKKFIATSHFRDTIIDDSFSASATIVARIVTHEIRRNDFDRRTLPREF